MSKKVIELLATGRAKYLGREDFDNDDCLDELLTPLTIINKDTELEVYFNPEGVDSNIPCGYSRFFKIKEEIAFTELLKKVQDDSGLSFYKDEITFMGNGNTDEDTDFEEVLALVS